MTGRRTVAAAVVLALAGVVLVALMLVRLRDDGHPEDVDRSPSVTEQQAATQAAHASHQAATGPASEVADRLVEVAGQDDLTVLVLGDSTGDQRTEWVALWAAHLADAGAQVTYRDWAGAETGWRPDALELGDTGREVLVWNASQSGARPGYPLENPEMLPEQADLVLVSFGHNGTREQEVTEMRQLLDRLEADHPEAPIGVVAQNPAVGGSRDHSAANREALNQLARQRGLPLIDVTRAFELHGDVESLLYDDLHPDDGGSRLWARTVEAFLAGADR